MQVASYGLRFRLAHHSKVNNRYHKDPATEPMVVIGLVEQQLIVAEDILRGWVADNAEDLPDY